MKFFKHSKKKTNWKYILIVAILAVLVGGVLVWQFGLKEGEVSPEEEGEEPTSWKTYRDEKWGFEIDYPVAGSEFWELPGTLQPFDLLISIQDIQIGILGEIGLFDSSCFGHGWEIIINNIAECSGEIIQKIDSGKEVISNSGIKGYRIEKGMFHLMEEGGIIFPLKENIVFDSFSTRPVLVMRYPLNSYTQEEMKVYDKIFSTFRFIEEETTEWKTYRNEKYGYEIDYPVVGWEFDEYLRLWMNEYRSGNFTLCRKYEAGIQKDKERLCIDVNLEFLYPYCYDCSWEEIFGRDDICEGIFNEEEFLEREEKSCHCIGGRIYGGKFEKEITSDFGVRGYQGKITMPYARDCIYEMIVYFPLKKEITSGKRSCLPLIALHYFDCPEYLDYGPEEIEVFDQILSSFRFIEE